MFDSEPIVLDFIDQPVVIDVVAEVSIVMCRQLYVNRENVIIVKTAFLGGRLVGQIPIASGSTQTRGVDRHLFGHIKDLRLQPK